MLAMPCMHPLIESAPMQHLAHQISIILDDSSAIKRAVALWILKTREVHRIPLSVMDSIALDAQSLFEMVIGQISNIIGSYFEGASSITEAKDRIFRELNKASSTFNILNGLETQSKQLSYFQTSFNFIVS